jgi:hypothetical protein
VGCLTLRVVSQSLDNKPSLVFCKERSGFRVLRKMLARIAWVTRIRTSCMKRYASSAMTIVAGTSCQHTRDEKK